MKSSVDRDNNYCHYVILPKAIFAITLHLCTLLSPGRIHCICVIISGSLPEIIIAIAQKAQQDGGI
jgi:hypothetical protein